MTEISVNIVKDGKTTNVKVPDDTMFAELAYQYFEGNGLNEKDCPDYKFIYNNVTIKSESCKSLKDLQITDGAQIDFTNGSNPSPKQLNIIVFKNGAPLTLQATPDMTLSQLILKYCQKATIKATDFNFTFDSKPLDPNSFKTLQELGMKDGSRINVVASTNPGQSFGQQLNILFIYEGRTITIQATPNTKFSELAVKFNAKAALKNDEKASFLFSSRAIPAEETKTIRELGFNNQTKIDVVIISNVVGAA